MIDHLQGAGFKLNSFNGEPSYNDYSPPDPQAIHEHEGEQNTRQGVTLHPKDENSTMQGVSNE